MNRILLKRNTSTGTQPATTDLQAGEIAFNTADLKIFCLNAAGTSVVQIAGTHTPLDAGDLVAGTVATARLGTGTASNSTFLRGDNTWATVPIIAGGAPSYVQYNSAGNLAGSPNFTFTPATNTLYAMNITGAGAGITNLNASNLATGIAPTAVLGSGTANATTFLRGDNTWQAPPAAPVASVFNRTGAVVAAAGG